MKPTEPLARLPYILLAAMTLASFGGPFVLLFVVRGGQSARWPPDRTIEWVMIALVFIVVIVLFCACVSLGWWFRPAGSIKNSKTRGSSS